MEIEQLRKEFNQLLANINEHSEQFTDSDHLPALEVSVMMSKVNKLLEVATVLKFVINASENKRKEPFVAEQIKVEKPKQAEEPIVEAQKSGGEAAIDIPIVEKNIISIENTAPAEANQKKAIVDKLAFSKIDSLKDAFSLNDRYLFANEMFKKDMQTFTDTVKKIDSCLSLIEAQQILSAFRDEYNWDTENEQVIAFYQLVERRFI